MCRAEIDDGCQIFLCQIFCFPSFFDTQSNRIRPMMELFRRLQLQVLLISTVEKSTAIQPYCDITYSIVRHGDANAIAPFYRLTAPQPVPEKETEP